MEEYDLQAEEVTMLHRESERQRNLDEHGAAQQVAEMAADAADQRADHTAADVEMDDSDVIDLTGVQQADIDEHPLLWDTFSPLMVPRPDAERARATRFLPAPWTPQMVQESSNHTFGLISLYNFKGGVGKTTNCFALAWGLAKEGRRVLMMDCDPQMNLTQTTLQFMAHQRHQGDIGQFLQHEVPNADLPANLYHGLHPLLAGRLGLKPIVCVEVPIDNGALFLLPGELMIAEFDEQLSAAYDSDQPRPTDNYPGGVYRVLQMTAKLYNCDLVVADLSPAIGALNRTILLTSNLFYLPCAPDYYSMMAVNSLAELIPMWVRRYDQFRARTVPNPPRYLGPEFSLPTHNVKFGGWLLVRFPYGRNFEIVSRPVLEWSRRVELAVQSLYRQLTQLQAPGHVPPPFDHVVPHEAVLNIKIPEYWSLSQISQRQSKPAAFLANADLMVMNDRGRWVLVARIDELKRARDHNQRLVRHFALTVLHHLTL